MKIRISQLRKLVREAVEAHRSMMMNGADPEPAQGALVLQHDDPTDEVTAIECTMREDCSCDECMGMREDATDYAASPSNSRMGVHFAEEGDDVDEIIIYGANEAKSYRLPRS